MFPRGVFFKRHKSAWSWRVECGFGGPGGEDRAYATMAMVMAEMNNGRWLLYKMRFVMSVVSDQLVARFF